MKHLQDWGFYLTVAVMVAIATILIATDSLPEKAAARFNTLTDVSIATNYKVIKEPTPQDNTLVYTLNEVAEKTIPIAEKDPRIKEIIDNAHTNKAAVTIAAIQPTVYEYRSDAKTAYSNSGMLRITVNQQLVDNRPYVQPASFDDLHGRNGESHQQVWNVMVDIDKGIVTDIFETSDRLMTEMLETNTIYIGMNMFLPNIAKIEPGTTLKWINTSDMLHNVVGVYKTLSGKQIPIDSGFMQKGDSWEYIFGEEGTMEYYCTTHSEDGMKASLIISK
ncbi:MAG: plastocyanin/azurin family copper-binding protein [Nitrososphaera sp.]|jgi:plastocyanin